MTLVLRGGCAAGALLLLAQLAPGQAQQADTAKKPKEYNPPPIFTASTPIEFTLSAPFGKLKKERSGPSTYRAAEIFYRGDSGTVRVPVRVRPRGIWRRRNCEIPPLRLNFAKDSVKKTIFRRLDGARLAMHCRDTDDYEQYVLQEFQLYRVQRLITPLSFDVRLVRVTYVDSEKKDTIATRYGFLLENESEFGPRMGGQVLDIKGAGPADLDGPESAVFGVWQYFIGNVDFSIAALHNVALLQRDTAYYVVAYDFDWSGAVNTRYSGPPPQLAASMKRVTDRLMRGYCTSAANFQRAIGLFKERKDAIYALYRDPLAAPLKSSVVNTTLRFFDGFYDVVDDPDKVRRLIIDRCVGGQS